MPMQILSVSHAKARFSQVTRAVLKTRRAAVIRTPAGFVQITPFELPEEGPPAPPGHLKLTKAELRLHNTFGESL